MSPKSVNYSRHASARLSERNVPSEVREAIRMGTSTRVLLRTDYCSSVDALVVRVSEGFWIHIAEGNVVATVYFVANGEQFARWASRHLRHTVDKARLLRQRLVTTREELVTAELARIWLTA